MCSPQCAKITLIAFNFLFFSCGVLLLAFGILGVANELALTNFFNSIPGVESVAAIINIPAVIVSSAIYMIVLGSIIFLLGFLGCCGAARVSKWMLFLYWVSLVAVLLAEVALIIFAAVAPSKIETHIQKMMYTSLTEHFEPVHVSETGQISLPEDVVAVAWTSMQFEVACCGVYNYSDYSTFKWNNTFHIPPINDTDSVSKAVTIVAVVPPSCCTLKSAGIPGHVDQFDDIDACLNVHDKYNSEGCYVAIMDLLIQYSYIAIGICSAIIAFELVLIATAIYLWRMKPAAREGKQV